MQQMAFFVAVMLLSQPASDSFLGRISSTKIRFFFGISEFERELSNF
jgi:hypothetical protein